MQKEQTMRYLLAAYLGRLHAAEKVFSKLLPRLLKQVHTKEFKDVLKVTRTDVARHLSRLESIRKVLGMKRGNHTCAAFEALVTECLDLIDTYRTGNLRDAAFLVELQQLELYKYQIGRSIHEFAKLLGEDEVVSIIDLSEHDDSLAAKRWAQIAIQVNAEAFVDHQSPECSVPGSSSA